jgi:ABC-type nitrate/sulfonate/bicarbonate transport system substrate-binding protein
MKNFNLAGLFAWLAAALLIAAAPSIVSAQPALKNVRMGVAGMNFSFLPFLAAERAGFYKQEGLRVEMIYMRSPVAIPALSSNQIQYTSHFGSVVTAAVKGFPVRVIFSTSDKQLFSFVAERKITSIADLKGKTISVSNPFGTNAYVTNQILRMHGLEPNKDVTFLYLAEESSRVAALKNGLVAAAVLIPPASIAMRSEGYRIILDTAEYFELPLSSLSASQELMQKNPDEVKAMLRASYRGLRFVKENREGSIDLITNVLRVDKKIATETYDHTARYLSEDGISSEKAIRTSIETMGGAQDKKVPTSAVADFTLLREVLKEAKR